MQEALTNVHKHARGAATDVPRCGAAGRGVTVRVTNAGRWPRDSLLPGSGAGLVGLRERIELVGGTLTAGTADDGGWRVEAWLPWARLRASDRATVDGVTRLLIVDDEALVRAGLRMILESADDLEVVAEAEDGADAVETVRPHRPGRGADGHPDAAPGRAGRDPRAAAVAGAAAGGRADHLRPRRLRVPGAAGGREPGSC